MLQIICCCLACQASNDVQCSAPARRCCHPSRSHCFLLPFLFPWLFCTFSFTISTASSPMRACTPCPAQGSGLAAMRWSGAPEHFPFAGASNVFWNVRASKLPVRFNYVNSLAAEAGLAPLASLSTNSSAKTADGANSAVPAPAPAAKETARNAATAAMFESSRRSAKLPVMDRPAWIQGYGQVAVDMPLDGNNPTLKEVSAPAVTSY